MNKEASFLKRIVLDASKLITDDFEVKAKDDKGDLVTNFDYEVEKFETQNIEFEDNGSKIPELLEELSDYVLRQQLTKENIRKIVNSFCAKYKIGPNFN